jgi:hypothetical protein
MKNLLICIAAWFNETRIPYLKTLLNNFLDNYSKEFKLKILIDTQTPETHSHLNEYGDFLFDRTIEVCPHQMEHPWHLTWKHRFHMMENLESYDIFYYVEDDMLLPIENFKTYLDKLNILWPHNLVPGFLRIEMKNNIGYVLDHWTKAERTEQSVVKLNNRRFVGLNHTYHAFWILDQSKLKDGIKNPPPHTHPFLRLSTDRERAASYPNLDLGKGSIIEISEDNKILPTCYSYHIANTYIQHPYFSKIKPDDLLIIK